MIISLSVYHLNFQRDSTSKLDFQRIFGAIGMMTLLNLAMQLLSVTQTLYRLWLLSSIPIYSQLECGVKVRLLPLKINVLMSRYLNSFENIFQASAHIRVKSMPGLSPADLWQWPGSRTRSQRLPSPRDLSWPSSGGHHCQVRWCPEAAKDQLLNLKVLKG